MSFHFHADMYAELAFVCRLKDKLQEIIELPAASGSESNKNVISDLEVYVYIQQDSKCH